MRKIHLAIATNNLDASIADYSERLASQPCVVVAGEYALWRTESLNLSIRRDESCAVGTIRHLGWEDPRAVGFTSDVDVNGILWERFSSLTQAAEIKAIWPEVNYDG